MSKPVPERRELLEVGQMPFRGYVVFPNVENVGEANSIPVSPLEIMQVSRQGAFPWAFDATSIINSNQGFHARHQSQRRPEIQLRSGIR